MGRWGDVVSMDDKTKEKELARITGLTNDDLIEEALESRCGDKREGHSAEFCHWQFATMHRVLRTRLRRIGFLHA